MTDPREPDPDAPDAYVVVPAGTGRRGRLPLVALGVAVVLLGGLAAWGALVAPGRTAPVAPPPVGSPVPRSPVAEVPTSGVPSPGPTLQRPSAGAGGLPTGDAASEDDAFAILAAAGGWRACPMWRGLGDGGTLRPEDVSAALGGLADVSGMVEIDDPNGRPEKVWVGRAEDDAARGFGGSQIVHVDGATWTAIPDGSGWQAVRLEPMTVDRPSLTAWQVRARAFPAPYCLADSVGGPPARVVEVPLDGDPVVRLYAETGWFVCRTWQRMNLGGAPGAAAIDAAADAAGVTMGPGWVTTSVPADDGRSSREVRVYVGDDPAIAGTRHGSQLVVIGTGEPRRAWLATSLSGRPFAVAFDVVRTPAGRTAWVPTDSAAGVVGDCPIDEVAGTPGAGAPAGAASGASATTPATVELLRGERTAAALLSERLGWLGCRMNALDAYPTDVTGTSIDRAATDAGVAFGPLRVDVLGHGSTPITAFLSDDLVDLARWTGAPVVALDGRPVAWLADETRADEWRPVVTPAGRTAWVQTGAAAWPDGGCDPPADATPAIGGIRSLTCWTDRDRCLDAVRRAIAIDPSAFTEATEVAAGLGSGCAATVRCLVTGPSVPVFVTAAPAGWASPDMIRVFVTTDRALSGTPGEVPRDEVTASMLALATRPSAALPTPDPVDAPPAGAACTGASLRGVLRGNPWDPRVAWVDTTPVRWPARDSAVFVPDLRLMGPDGGILAEAGQEVGVVGRAATPGVDGFDACSVGVP